MARKKQNSEALLSAVRIGFTGLLALAIGVGAFKAAGYVFLHAPYFTVKTVFVDPSLNFISGKDLAKLHGMSIFLIDLDSVRAGLGRKYPQVSELKVVRRFPDQVQILAKPRKPFAQARFKEQTLTLDDYGVILSTTSRQDEKMPFITGIAGDPGRVAPGQPLSGQDVKTALQILQAFGDYRALDSYAVKTIDVTNASKIEFTLSNDLKVFMDKDEINHKVKILSVVLAKGQLDPGEVRYLDLRFKEPIVGKK